LIERPVSQKWLHALKMTSGDLGGDTWLKEPSLGAERTIKTVSSNEITLTVPLTDSYDSKMLDPGQRITVTKLDPADGRINEVGVENLKIVANPRSIELPIGGRPPLASFDGIHLQAVKDGWVRNVHLVNMVYGLMIESTSLRITVDTVDVDIRQCRV